MATPNSMFTNLILVRRPIAISVTTLCKHVSN